MQRALFYNFDFMECIEVKGMKWNKTTQRIVVGIGILSMAFIPAASFAIFRGGNVHDATREIKEKLDTAQAAKIYKEMEKIQDLNKTMSEQLQGVKMFRDDIQKLFSSVNGLRIYAKGILNSNKVKDDMESVYRIDWKRAFNEGKLDEEIKRIDKERDTEAQQAVDAANSNSEAVKKVQAEVKKVLDQHARGKLSEIQKTAMLQALAVQMKNLKTSTAAQDVVLTVIDDRREANQQMVNSYMKSIHSFELAPADLQTDSQQ